MHIEAPPVTTSDDPSLRGEVIHGMITALRSRPLHEVTPEVVAAAAGVDTDVVDRTFPSWDGLLLATIDRWNEERTVPLMPWPNSTAPSGSCVRSSPRTWPTRRSCGS